MPGAGPAPLVAVIDVGKTNARVSVADGSGHVLESAQTANVVRAGPPWRHHDLKGLGEWVLATLAAFCRTHPVGRVIATGHGSGTVLVGADPDAGGDGAVLPMIDYEEACPPAIDAVYRREAGGYLERGSAIMMAQAHQARQMLRSELGDPAGFARAAHALAVAPYWAWRLSGVAASEVSALGAQSHLWDVLGRRWAGIVARRGWERLLPPVRPAWTDLGPVRPGLARRHGLPEGLRIHLGAHDSSANFYRYQAGGLSSFTLVSTGTWIVAMSNHCPPARLAEERGMTLNADVTGRPVGSALCMGGREFSAIAGEAGMAARACLADLAAVIARGTVAVPTFGDDAGQFPGTARRGRIEGPQPATPAEARALALLHVAMLTDTVTRVLGSAGDVVLDGAYLADPLYPGLVAALRPDAPVRVSPEPAGVTAGAALLSFHGSRTGSVPLALEKAAPLALPGLAAWAELWRSRAAETGGGTR